MGRAWLLWLSIAMTVACSDTPLTSLEEGEEQGEEEPEEPAEDLPGDLADLADDCEPIAWLQCGETVWGDSGDPAYGRTDVIDFWPVSQGNYRGPEVAYAWDVDHTGPVEWRMIHPRPMEVDHDLFVLDSARSCNADAAIKRGFNDVFFDVTEGDVRVLVLDGFDGDTGEYEIRLDCLEDT